MIASLECVPPFKDPLMFPRRPSSLSMIARVHFSNIASILVSRVPRVCSCWLRSCSRSPLSRFSLSSASLFVRDKFLAKHSSVLSCKRFSLLLTSRLLLLFSSRRLSRSTWTAVSSSLILIDICSLCSTMLSTILVKASSIDASLSTNRVTSGGVTLSVPGNSVLVETRVLPLCLDVSLPRCCWILSRDVGRIRQLLSVKSPGRSDEIVALVYGSRFNR